MGATSFFLGPSRGDARELVFDALRPHMADQVYVNYMHADDAERIRAVYGPNFDRPRDLEGRYDPDNLFRLNQNIAP